MLPLGIALLAACVACGRGPAESPERIVQVGRRCAGLEMGGEPLDPRSARVFVEVVDVSSDRLAQPVGDWLANNAVKARSTAHVVAFAGVPTSTPWGQCVDAVCGSQERSLTLTATLPGRASEPIRLALRIEEASPDGAVILLDTTLAAPNQAPVVLPPAPAVSPGSLVVTAYLLRRHDDLHRVLECQVESGAAHE